jgi:hypothetical protein
MKFPNLSEKGLKLFDEITIYYSGHTLHPAGLAGQLVTVWTAMRHLRVEEPEMIPVIIDMANEFEEDPGEWDDNELARQKEAIEALYAIVMVATSPAN